MIPDPPTFEDEEIKRCKKNRDYTSIYFKWYQYIGQLGTLVVYIDPKSKDFNEEIPKIHYHVILGLLNRCLHLMMSNMELSHQGKFRPATLIIDRCIFESAITLQWLCIKDNAENFLPFWPAV